MDFYCVVKNPLEKKRKKERKKEKKERKMDETRMDNEYTKQRYKHARLIYPTNRPIPRDGRPGVNAERVSVMHG